MIRTGLKPLYRKIIFFNLFSACFCMSGQLALNTALSYLFSNSVYVFSFFVGIYLMAMGLGALIADRLPINKHNIFLFIIVNAILAIVIVNPGIFSLLYFNEITRIMLRTEDSSLHQMIFPLGVLFTLLLGIVSGIELPLFSKLIEANKEEDSSILTAILTTDYIGAFVGSITFALLVYPFMGLMKGVVFSQLFLTSALIILTITSFEKINKKIIGILGLVVTYVIFSYIYIEDLLEYLVKLTN